MNTLNAAIVTALLAMGLAGNAMAAPNNHASDRDHKVVKKVVIKKNSPKHIVVKKATPKKVVKRVVAKKSAPKRAVKRVVKRVVKKSAPKKVVAKTYRVRSGDTLSRISARTHISVSKLIRLNNLWGNKANQLRVGMRIRLA